MPLVKEMPRMTTVAISRAKASVIAALTVLNDHTSRPLTSLYAPKAARPLYAIMPKTALISMGLYTGQDLLRTA